MRSGAASVRLRPSPARTAAAGAPGLPGAPPPAPRIPGPGGERGGRPARAAGRARAARSAESWGRSLARPPPRSQSLAFCAATLPDLRGAAPPPRPPRAVAPGKFASPGRAVGTPRAAARLGKVSRVPEGRRLRASHPRSPRAGKCAAATGGRAPGSGRRRASPGPWPPDKGVLEVVAEARPAFPRRHWLRAGKRRSTHLWPLLAEECVCGAAGGSRECAREARSGAETARGARPRPGSPPRVEVSARGRSARAWPGPRPRLGCVPGAAVPAHRWSPRLQLGSGTGVSARSGVPAGDPAVRHPRGGSSRVRALPPGRAGSPPAGHGGAWISHKTALHFLRVGDF